MKNKILFLILIVLILITFICAYQILKWYINKIDIEKQTKEIDEISELKEIENSDKLNIINPPTDKENDYWDYIKMPFINVKFLELLKKNPETVGWIKVNGTNINYPIVKRDNSYYLTHSFDGSYNKAGWVFLDYRNDLNNLSKNNIVYAHGRLDKTMFGTLKDALNTSWSSNKENHIISISSPNDNSMWQVFSVYTISTENYYTNTSFKNNEDYEEFLNTITNRSHYNFNVKTNVNDKIITLSTCHKNNTNRVVMHAKLIKTDKHK